MSMSQENVDFLTGLFAAADSLDNEAMLAALPTLVEQACDPEIEWVEDPQRADGRVYREFYDEGRALQAVGLRE